LGPSSLKKIIIFKGYVVGDDVRAMSPEDEAWYPGVVSKSNDDGTFQVKWDDPDGGDETANVDPEFMKRVVVFRDYKPDDEVEAAYPDDGNKYSAVVVAKNKDGTFKVKWDDADGGPEESDVSPKDMRYPPIPLDSLEVGQKYTGTVMSVRDFGAFVDIGCVAEGLLHISRISTNRVNDITEHLEEGQQVEVWISGVRDDGKFGLTMVEGLSDSSGGGRRAPADLGPFVGLDPSDKHDGVVVRTAPFGAFVRVTLADGSEAEGLVHISQIRDGFIERVEDELEVGQEVQVRVQKVDELNGKMSLSMKDAGGGRAPREPKDLSPFEDIASDQWLEGKVARIAPFGAFVTVTSPDGKQGDGLVHVTQIRDGFVESVEAELEVGQEVKARVLSVDAGQGKMSLSLKDEAESSDEEAYDE